MSIEVPKNPTLAEILESSEYKNKTDGSFLASIRMVMLESLGNGDYSAQTSARKLFEGKINPGMGAGFLNRRDRSYL